MEHLSSDMEQQVNGEETKYKSFVAKDTAKERYPKLLFVNLTAALLALFFLYAQL
jgi:hypothetical protein